MNVQNVMEGCSALRELAGNSVEFRDEVLFLGAAGRIIREILVEIGPYKAAFVSHIFHPLLEEDSENYDEIVFNGLFDLVNRSSIPGVGEVAWVPRKRFGSHRSEFLSGNLNRLADVLESICKVQTEDLPTGDENDKKSDSEQRFEKLRPTAKLRAALAWKSPNRSITFQEVQDIEDHAKELTIDSAKKTQREFNQMFSGECNMSLANAAFTIKEIREKSK